jgi:hypothetical protein
MKHDSLDFRYDMSASDIVWRVVFLTFTIGVLLLDLFFWRP